MSELNTSTWTKIGTISQLYTAIRDSDGWSKYTYQNLYAIVSEQNQDANYSKVTFSLRQYVEKYSFYNYNAQNYSFSINNIVQQSGQVAQNQITTSEKEILTWSNIVYHDNNGECNFTFSYFGPISSSSMGTVNKTITGNCSLPAYKVAPNILAFGTDVSVYKILSGTYSYSGTATKGEIIFNNMSYPLSLENNTFKISYGELQQKYESLPCTLRLYNGSNYDEIINTLIFNWPKQDGISNVSISQDKTFDNPSLDARYTATLTLSDEIGYFNSCLVNFVKITSIDGIESYQTVLSNKEYTLSENNSFDFYLYDTNLKNGETFQIQVALNNNGFTSNFVSSNKITIMPGTTKQGFIYISILEPNKSEEDWESNQI